MRAKLLIGLLLVIGVGLFITHFYQISDLRGRSELNAQLQKLIDQRNKADIRAVSDTSMTAEFFMKLPKGAKVETNRTSDSQGGIKTKDGMSLYFVALLNGRQVSVYMKETYHGLFSTWKIDKILV